MKEPNSKLRRSDNDGESFDPVVGLVAFFGVHNS
jgi:hypothetical protein